MIVLNPKYKSPLSARLVAACYFWNAGVSVSGSDHEGDGVVFVRMWRSLLLGLTILCLTGCANNLDQVTSVYLGYPVGSDPEGRRLGFEGYLRMYPQDKTVDRRTGLTYSQAGRQQLEALYFGETEWPRTIQAYENFLYKYPTSVFADEVTGAVDDMRRVQEALHRIGEAEVLVTSSGGRCWRAWPGIVPYGDLDFGINLVKGLQPSHNDSRIPAGYPRTSEALTRLAQLRCAEVLKSLASEDALPQRHAAINITVWHGVRTETVVRLPLGGGPHRLPGSEAYAPRIWCQIVVSVERLRSRQSPEMDVETIAGLCRVAENNIPSISIVEEGPRFPRY